MQHAQALSNLFCDKSHKLSGVVDNSRKPVDNPSHIGAELTIVNSTRRYLLQRLGKSSFRSESTSVFAFTHMYTASIIGEHKNIINIIAITDPIMSVIIFYSQKI